MDMTRLFRAALPSALLGLALALPAAARDCVRPGQVLDAPLRSVLQAGLDPDDLRLSVDFDGVQIQVKPLARAGNRLRVRMPHRGLPAGQLFWLRHTGADGSRDIILTQGRTCETGTAEAGRQLSRSKRPLERATASDVAAPSGAPEYLLAGRSAAMGAAEALLTEQGAEVLRRTDLGGLGLRMLAVDLNGTMTLSQLRGALARRGVAAKADRHTVYRSAAGGATAGQATGYALEMVGQNPAMPCRLGRQIRVGLIDGPVDAGVPALAGVPVRSTSVLAGGDHQGSADHATGIAALIASPGGAAGPSGIAPGAQIYSVVAFARTGGREVARLENIAQALDWLMESRVELINMSLTGPENETLAEIIRLADARGIVMLAATGNGGREGVSYPASDPRVIGITAVDAARRLYRKANYGQGVDFAAPGVDILVPGGHRSGTSYASAIATAVVAQMMARGTRSREALIRALAASAEDLGAPGLDAQFGHGLMRLPGGC